MYKKIKIANHVVVVESRYYGWTVEADYHVTKNGKYGWYVSREGFPCYLHPDLVWRPSMNVVSIIPFKKDRDGYFSSEEAAIEALKSYLGETSSYEEEVEESIWEGF